MNNPDNPKIIRTRFAPSPTGYLHIGGLRTALYTYLFAKQNRGQFILRLEDTDQKRLTPDAAKAIYDGLKWAGLNYDEGPDVGGPYGPYIQSERLDIYKKYANELIEKQKAYYCFCDEKTLTEMRAEQIAGKSAPKYDRRCQKLTAEKIKEKLQAKIPYVIRLKIPDNRLIEFNDLVRGKIAYNTNDLDDQILLKTDGFPTYHLALAIDDHLMAITHVTRTEEWLPSTPKHILLYEYFGWTPPQWAHLPLLLNLDKSKMSKRRGDVALENYIKKGYLPEAIINYLAFLGWNPGTTEEIYSLEKLLRDFKLEKVHKAGAIFNPEKLDWYNSHYLRQISQEKLLSIIRPYLPPNNRFNNDQLQKMLTLEQERSRNLAVMAESINFYFQLPTYDKNILKWKEMTNEELRKSLAHSQKILEGLPKENFNKETIAAIMLKEAANYKNRGELLWPLRVALSGQKNSPPPFDIAEILGLNESLNRIKFAAQYQ